jgi:hypothetical protein
MKYFSDLPESIRSAILKLEEAVDSMAEAHHFFMKKEAEVARARAELTRAVFDRLAESEKK